MPANINPVKSAEIFCISQDNNVFFLFEIITNVLDNYFCFIILNTYMYVMGLRPLEILYSFSAGIDFRRQF